MDGSLLRSWDVGSTPTVRDYLFYTLYKVEYLKLMQYYHRMLHATRLDMCLHVEH